MCFSEQKNPNLEAKARKAFQVIKLTMCKTDEFQCPGQLFVVDQAFKNVSVILICRQL
jgi:hypothetical protein